MQVFDRHAVRLHRDRAAAGVGQVAAVLEDAADRLLDRLDDITRHFTQALEIGGRGIVAPKLRARGMQVVSSDFSPRMAALNGGACVGADEELLHWVNDLPGCLIQIRRCLAPDGLFLASMPVLGTLAELRGALTEAEADLTGGGAPRVSPFPDLRDCAALLQRAGFALPVVDVEEISLLYADPLALLRDLRAGGETNAVRLRDRRPPPRDLFAAALGRLERSDGRIRATLRLAMLTGWAPAPSQPQPLARGSAKISLAQALGEDPESSR
jgi:NADH dehydrogenase [ubiquinone] 1 alpha subcomplex assembly factor 5